MRERGTAIHRIALAVLLALASGSCVHSPERIVARPLASLLDADDARVSADPDVLDLDVRVVAMPGDLAGQLRALGADVAPRGSVSGGAGGCGRPGWTALPPFALSAPRAGDDEGLRQVLAAIDSSHETFPITGWRARAGTVAHTVLEHREAVPYRVVLDEGAEVRHVDTTLSVAVRPVVDAGASADQVLLDVSLSHELPDPSCQVEGTPPRTVPERVDARLPLRTGQIAVLGASLGLIGFERFADPWGACADAPRLLVLIRPRGSR